MTLDYFLKEVEGRYVSLRNGEARFYSGHSLEVAIGYGPTSDDAIRHGLSVLEERKKLERNP